MCKFKKCHNGGKCISVIGDVVCKCAAGYSGLQCDKSIEMSFLLFFTVHIKSVKSKTRIRHDKNTHSIKVVLKKRADSKED